MKISDNGLNIIKKFEGCRLTAYQDAVGVWTIGYGTTNADKAITGISIRQGLRISQETADEWLRQSVDKKYGPKVDKYSAYNWNQNEFDALVSFAYNVGSIDQLTAGGTRSRKVIAEKMLSYCRAAVKANTGLLKRRQKERALFLTPVSCTGATMQAAEKKDNRTEQKTEPAHVQLNYRQYNTYTVTASSLIVRTKPKLKNGAVEKGTKLYSLSRGKEVRNLATMRLNDEIWMYIGRDSKGREKWICADTGNISYVK